MRSASDFDRPYAGESQLQSLVFDDPGVSARSENLKRELTHTSSELRRILR